MARGDTNDAFELLLADSPLKKRESLIVRFQEMTNSLLRGNGAIVGFEKMDEKQSGQLLTLVYYLYQEETVTRWALYYYRPFDDAPYTLTNLDATQTHSIFDNY